MAAQSSSSSGANRGLLPYIAAFKLVKAALLIVVGCAALGLVRQDSARLVEHWLAHLSSPTGREFVQRGLGRVLRMGAGKIWLLALGAWLYAALFLVEGIGLWRRRRWAEYLTIVATASFIPFEIHELMKEASATRISALALNVAVVVYLVVRLWRDRRYASSSGGAPHHAVA